MTHYVALIMPPWSSVDKNPLRTVKLIANSTPLQELGNAFRCEMPAELKHDIWLEVCPMFFGEQQMVEMRDQCYLRESALWRMRSSNAKTR